MPKITPKTADMLNERIEAHFKSYPKEKEVAVTPDGQLFHCDEKTNHGKKGLHDASNHAKKRGFGDVIIVSREEPVIEANAEEEVEVKLVKKGKAKTEDPAAKLATQNAAIEAALKPIYAALKGKKLAKAVGLYKALDPAHKPFLTKEAEATLSVEAAKA